MIGTAAVFVAGRMNVLVLDVIQVINPVLILLIVARLRHPIANRADAPTPERAPL